MQFTITYRCRFGAKFAFIESDSAANAKRQIQEAYPGAVILTCRENNPPLPTIAAQD